jgi:purine-binding chemotaxis protein CheW
MNANHQKSDLAGRYLLFSLGEEKYGININNVQEILGVFPTTTIPLSKSCFKGVINLRGKIIPAIDLRLALGLEDRAYDERTCFIVTTGYVAGELLVATIIIDAVDEVHDFKDSEIVPAVLSGDNSSENENLLEEGQQNYVVAGIARDKDQVYSLLNLNTLFNELISDVHIPDVHIPDGNLNTEQSVEELH